MKKWAKNKLKKENYKMTKTRKRVVEYITDKCNMFSAPKLISELSGLDRVSIYRALDVLEELDVIHSTVNKHGEQMYELHQPDQHHHHAICGGCDKQKCIDCPVDKDKFPDLKDIHHSLYFSFTCKNCI